jgi:hypothetical protein
MPGLQNLTLLIITSLTFMESSPINPLGVRSFT